MDIEKLKRGAEAEGKVIRFVGSIDVEKKDVRVGLEKYVDKLLRKPYSPHWLLRRSKMIVYLLTPHPDLIYHTPSPR
jgi:hypothetical protein